MKRKITRLLCCMLMIAVLASSVVCFTGCEDSEIYKLIAGIADNDKNNYSFETTITLQIDIETLQSVGLVSYFQQSLEVIPKEIELTLNGSVRKAPLSMEAEIAIKGYADTATKIYIKDNELFFELNDLSRIIIDIFWATGIVESSALSLFCQKIDYNSNTVLCFDITDFDLSYFDEYISYADAVIKVDSTVKYGGGKNFTVPNYDKSKTLYFKNIKKQIEKELLSVPGYRYIELACILSTENSINYLDIMAIKESGNIIPLERVKIDSDLSAVRKNPELFEDAEIIPLRYIFELLGKKVEWNKEKETVSVFDNNTEIKCDGKMINSKMYMSILNVEFFDYSYEIRDIGEYIEFAIYLNSYY